MNNKHVIQWYNLSREKHSQGNSLALKKTNSVFLNFYQPLLSFLLIQVYFIAFCGTISQHYNLFPFIPQAVCSWWARWQLVLEVDGVFRSTHQQVEHVCANVQEERRCGRSHIQQLPVCCGWTRCPRFQPLFQTLWLCWEVSEFSTNTMLLFYHYSYLTNRVESGSWSPPCSCIFFFTHGCTLMTCYSTMWRSGCTYGWISWSLAPSGGDEALLPFSFFLSVLTVFYSLLKHMAVIYVEKFFQRCKI